MFGLKEEKSRFQIVLEIAKAANEAEEEMRNQELFEKKEDPIKKINEYKAHRNFSLEAYNEYMNGTKEEESE